MRHIAIDVAHSVVCVCVCFCLFACLSVCVLGTRVSCSCAKTAEPIEMPFEGESKNQVLDGIDIPHGNGQPRGVTIPRCVLMPLNTSLVTSRAVGKIDFIV